jgi:hypothetical protein
LRRTLLQQADPPYTEASGPVRSVLPAWSSSIRACAFVDCASRTAQVVSIARNCQSGGPPSCSLLRGDAPAPHLHQCSSAFLAPPPVAPARLQLPYRKPLLATALAARAAPPFLASSAAPLPSQALARCAQRGHQPLILSHGAAGGWRRRATACECRLVAAAKARHRRRRGRRCARPQRAARAHRATEHLRSWPASWQLGQWCCMQRCGVPGWRP